MTPVLGIPVINRPDLLAECIASIDHDVRLVIIDNSREGFAAEIAPAAWTVRPPSNLGVAASWNFIIRTAPADPYWLIANADTTFGPGDLARLCAEMERGGPRWVGINGDWRVFGLSAEAVEKVGFFDEGGFVPIYCEDADYEYRCSLAGIPWYFLHGGSTHVGSVSYRSDERNGQHNARTYPANVAYYRQKWGGSPRSGECFTTPFNAGGHLGDWRLRLDRLRDNAWD